MLLFPTKQKLTKSFTGKKIAKKNDNKIVNLKFGNFCVIANENSFITNFQIEAIRRVLRRTFKKRHQIFFRIFPFLPITKKPNETRLGRGKGKVKYWSYVVRKGEIIVEIRSAHRQIILQKSKTIQKNFQ